MKRSVAVLDDNETQRERLLEKRTEVISAMGVKFDTLARLGRVNEEDQAQLSHEESVSLRLNSLDYSQLRMVEEALDRLNAGDYGVCLGCEEPISAKRLRALPWARYCITCQEAVGAGMDADSSRDVRG